MKKRIISIILILLLCLTCLPVSVFAEETDVESIMEQAVAFLEAEKYEEAIPLLTEAATLGNAIAQYNLGVCYGLGLGVDQDYEKAVEYLRLAADQGMAEAQFSLGGCYHFGLGVDQDYEAAVRYYRLAADQGLAEAQTNLGYCYLNGEGVEQDYEEALKYFTLAAEQGVSNAIFGIGEYYYYAKNDWAQAAEWYQKALDAGYEPDEEEEEHVADVAEYLMDQAWVYIEEEEYEASVPLLMEAAALGNARAQYNLGYSYYYGEGVEQDYEEAVRYYRLAADQGYAKAQFNLGVCYENGYGVEQDYEKAVEYYRLAADQGNAYAQVNLGVCYEKGIGVDQDYAKAVEYYHLAADQGLAIAQYNLGVCYENGFGIDQDYEKAVEYYRLAADQGLAEAQCSLGFCYESGFGVDQDYEKAIEYYRLAADQGLAEAQCSLGVCYYFGEGVEQNYEEAVRYFRLAADQGYAEAQYNLGICFYYGEGVEQDYEEALKYFTLAAEQGVSNAMFGIGECYYEMNEWKTAAEWYIKALEAGYEPDEEDIVHIAEVLTSRFTDVNVSDWYYDSVGYVAARGIMTGMRADYFGAAETLSRGQFATVLYRMAGKPEVDYEDVFPDVKESDWFGVPVSWAAENGVVTGYKNGKFGPADDITREQIAVMLYRYAEYMEYDTSEKADLSKYPDGNKVSSWAKEAMEWAVGAGIVKGQDGGKTLDPQKEACRAACATMVQRFIQKYAG